MIFLFNLNEKGSILNYDLLKLIIWKAFVVEDVKPHIYPVIKNSTVLG
jgi:hypothetical protein